MDFDSKEEMYFQWWIDDLVSAGYIDEVVYQPEPFITSDKITYTFKKQLKTKTKIIEKVLSGERRYTPDYKIYWTDKAKGLIYKEIDHQPIDNPNAIFWASSDDQGFFTIIEVKGGYDQGNMTRLARINIDLVHNRYGQYIELVRVSNSKNSFFDKTFTPSRFIFTDAKKARRKLKYEPKSLNEFIKAL